VLARHTRALFLNARAATAMAEPVARLLAGELGRDEAWITAQVIEFHGLAKQYRVT
jgi:glycerol-3-phosphate dehydrogenase